MKAPRVPPRQFQHPPARRWGFSLVELLVVMAIIGLLAAIGLPRLRGLTRGNAMNAAVRQLLDDLALARLKALSSRTRVYVVFLPTLPNNYLQRFRTPQYTNAYRTLANLFDSQSGAYAILTERTIGDQPGRGTPRYITEWKRLPEGVILVPDPLKNPVDVTRDTALSRPDAFNRFLGYPSLQPPQGLPFPLTGVVDPAVPPILLPCIVFTPMGQMVDGLDREILLIRGSVFTVRDNSGMPVRVDIALPDPAKQDFELTRLHLTGVTGRANVQPIEMR